jgi:SAM-dependent methyltransferase
MTEQLCAAGDGRLSRVEVERHFWDEHIPAFEHIVNDWRTAPEPNCALALDALEPLAGKRVLDFACGTGVTSARLAARGAEVIGIDIAPEPLELARALFDHVGLQGTLVRGDLREMHNVLPEFDAIFGQYALHHVDLGVFAPLLAGRLKPGGAGAFIETMAGNPLLMLARRHLIGRWGVPRYGSPDEKPLDGKDLAEIQAAFGELEVQLGEMRFLRILDRQVFRYRYPWLSDLAGSLDDRLARWPPVRRLSYHQVVVVRRR